MKEKYYREALIKTASEGNLEGVKELIANGADVNSINSNSESALIRAAKHNHIEVLKYLIGEGASLEPESVYDQSALAIAFEKKNIEAIKILVKCGALIRSWMGSDLNWAKGFENEDWYKKIEARNR